MANRHFGTIADVWKHLALAEILAIETPSEYWETNAGSARYPLTHSMGRDYGVFYFREHALESSTLASSRYFSILKEMSGEPASPGAYPGSPSISMATLGGNRHYVFCDIDRFSIESIKNAASELRLPEADVECVNGDGVGAILEKEGGLQAERACEVLVLVDPCGGFVEGRYVTDEPFRDRPGGNPVDCFFRLSKRGFKTMLWYGFESLGDKMYGRAFSHARITASLNSSRVQASAIHLWCGEIYLSRIGDPGFAVNPGVRGCGVLSANLCEKARAVCSDLGKELARIYRGAELPGGHSGALTFASVGF